VIRALVKEREPGPGASVSNGDAAMSSVVPSFEGECLFRRGVGEGEERR
jgi:hypothetical protein